MILFVLLLFGDPGTPREAAQLAYGHALGLPKEQRPFARYISTYPLPDHLRFSGRLTLNLAVNSLSSRRAFAYPQPIGPHVYYLDLLSIAEPDDVQRLIDGWKLFAAEDPWMHDGLCDGHVGLLARETGEERSVVRLDHLWVRGMLDPVYSTLMAHGESVDEMRKRYGVDRAGSDAAGDRWAAAIRESAVSNRKERVVVRREGRTGAEYETLDFLDHRKPEKNPSETLVIFRDGKRFHQTLSPDGGEYIWRLRNGLFAYGLGDAKGKRVDFGPSNLVSSYRSPNSDPTIYNGRSCFDCHGGGYEALNNWVPAMLDQQTKLLASNLEELQTVLDDYKGGIERQVAADQLSYSLTLAELVRPLVATQRDIPDTETCVEVSEECRLSINRWIWSRVDRKRAAIELGMSDQEFADYVSQTPDTALAALMVGETLERSAWERLAGKIVRVYHEE